MGPSVPKQKTEPMPDPAGPEAEASRRRSMEAARARSGRASTILSGNAGGGGDYTKQTTG